MDEARGEGGAGVEIGRRRSGDTCCESEEEEEEEESAQDEARMDNNLNGHDPEMNDYSGRDDDDDKKVKNGDQMTKTVEKRAKDPLPNILSSPQDDEEEDPSMDEAEIESNANDPEEEEEVCNSRSDGGLKKKNHSNHKLQQELEGGKGATDSSDKQRLPGAVAAVGGGGGTAEEIKKQGAQTARRLKEDQIVALSAAGAATSSPASPRQQQAPRRRRRSSRRSAGGRSRGGHGTTTTTTSSDWTTASTSAAEAASIPGAYAEATSFATEDPASSVSEFSPLGDVEEEGGGQNFRRPPQEAILGGGEGDEGSLVNANLVTPMDELPMAVRLQPTASTTTPTASTTRMSSGSIFRSLLVVFVVVVIIGIILMAVLLFNGQRQGSTDNATSSDGTNNQSVPLQQQQPQQQQEEERILNLLPEISIPLIRDGLNNNNTSPQLEAFQWIMGDPNLSNYSNPRIQTRYILATLFFATNGLNWINNTHWLSYQHHECLWYVTPYFYNVEPAYLKRMERAGHKFVILDEMLDIAKDIPCSTTTSTAGHNDVGNDNDDDNNSIFQHLILWGNDLQGTLPQQFFYLSSLRSFNFNRNPHLAGAIDSTLATGGMSHNLMAMSFAGSPKITGQIPTQIGLMTNLLEITFHFTNIQATIPTELFLLSNSLKGIRMGFGRIPTQIGTMSLLRYISFQNQNKKNAAGGLTGVIPSQLGLLTALESITMVDSGSISMTGHLPSQIGLATSLWRLNLRGFNVGSSATIPTEIAQLTNLERLALGSNFTGRIPTQLGRLTKLEQLNFADCRLTGSIPSQLGLLTLCTAMRFHGAARGAGSVGGGSNSMIGSSTAFNQPEQQQQQQLTGTVPPILCSNGPYPLEQLENVLVPFGVKGLSFDCSMNNTTSAIGNNLSGHPLCGCDWCPCH